MDTAGQCSSLIGQVRGCGEWFLWFSGGNGNAGWPGGVSVTYAGSDDRGRGSRGGCVLDGIDQRVPSAAMYNARPASPHAVGLLT
ncbi:hypothetical protein N7510_009127 [Penicillium lagena]|uniref:uncharacterized protein n=1 Tax=Penicillium lagena TaxID=94218 RepID=UPI0025408802|nr:uncharacterized protein N7510_009127 [Penicillium lagena]KAJ5606346.1 hypothetical protein N7510_009127 [Penicillium lagena]